METFVNGLGRDPIWLHNTVHRTLLRKKISKNWPYKQENMITVTKWSASPFFQSILSKSSDERHHFLVSVKLDNITAMDSEDEQRLDAFFDDFNHPFIWAIATSCVLPGSNPFRKRISEADICIPNLEFDDLKCKLEPPLRIVFKIFSLLL